MCERIGVVKLCLWCLCNVMVMSGGKKLVSLWSCLIMSDHHLYRGWSCVCVGLILVMEVTVMKRRRRSRAEVGCFVHCWWLKYMSM